MKTFFSGVLIIVLSSVCNCQIITVQCSDTIAVKSSKNSIRLVQSFAEFPNGVTNSFTYTEDYKELNKDELESILKANSISYTQLKHKIDTSYIRKSDKIEVIRDQFVLEIKNIEPKQIAVLKELDSKPNNVRIDKPMFIYIDVEENADKKLTNKAIDKAKLKADKIAKHLSLSVADMNEIEILSEFPEKIPTSLQAYNPTDRYPITLTLKVSFNTKK